MPLHRRLPKSGFTNIFRQEFQVVNLKDLTRLNPGEITADALKAAGLIRSLPPSRQRCSGTARSTNRTP